MPGGYLGETGYGQAYKRDGAETASSEQGYVRLNVEDARHAKESGLTLDDGRLLAGALTYKDHTIGEVMTPLEATYALPVDAERWLLPLPLPRWLNTTPASLPILTSRRCTLG